MPKITASVPPARKARVAPTKTAVRQASPARAASTTGKTPAAEKPISAVAKAATASKLSAAKPTKPPRAKPQPSANKLPVSKPVKVKAKLVRDSFAMPAADFALIDALKDRALGFRRPTKKSELLRAGLRALTALTAEQLKTALNQLEPLKPGRPKKDD